MAEQIQAIRAYSPRIKPGITVTMQRLVRFVSSRSGLNEGIVMNVLLELRDTIAHHSMVGEAVKLDGLGTFTPSVDLAGTFKMTYRADRWLKGMLNVPHAYLGDMENKDMIGKTIDELVARWNLEHPGDPIKKSKK
jgi:hypothetical protein